LLSAFKKLRILVVGDLMLDRYVFGKVERISPEAPVPVLHVEREEARPGGASNVALNIKSLGGGGLVSGIIGCDAAGADLKQVLQDSGLTVAGVFASSQVQTTVKTRVIADRQQVVRVDRESGVSDFARAEQQLRAYLRTCVNDVDAILIEDYGKGIVNQDTVDMLLEAASARGIPAGFDPKDNHHLRIPWMTVATPNYREACEAAGIRETPLPAGHWEQVPAVLRDTGRILSDRWQTACLMITLGPRGVYVCTRDGEEKILPTEAREVYDVSGAGDTFITAALLALTAGADYVEAAKIANYASGVVVGKLGTATCSTAELLAFIQKCEKGGE
jgi:D-beta-D-heptose 7-phosphate kinase/D-beta-D-heptose 1-phosphate adenosyltransferase